MNRRRTIRLLSGLLLAALLLPALAVRAADSGPGLRSAKGLILDLDSGQALYEKEPDAVTAIASVTKLMTAMVVIDAKLPMEEKITVTRADRDQYRGSGSRLAYDSVLTRRQLLQLALMASENRAANALARTYPGGTTAFVAAMNRKAKLLGMRNSHFSDPAGLHSENVSTAHDLVRMVKTALDYDLIRQFTTSWEMEVPVGKRRALVTYHNTNRLLNNDDWEIGLSKTGYISDSGRCLVMQARIAGAPVILVLLDSWGKLTPLGDANRARKWIEKQKRDS